jgi:hypothetical protein
LPIPELHPIVIGFEQRVSAVYVKHARRHVTQGPGIGFAIEFGHLLEHAVVCAARGFFHAPAQRAPALRRHRGFQHPVERDAKKRKNRVAGGEFFGRGG